MVSVGTDGPSAKEEATSTHKKEAKYAVEAPCNTLAGAAAIALPQVAPSGGAQSDEDDEKGWISKAMNNILKKEVDKVEKALSGVKKIKGNSLDEPAVRAYIELQDFQKALSLQAPPNEGVTIPKRCICAATDTSQCEYGADGEGDSDYCVNCGHGVGDGHECNCPCQACDSEKHGGASSENEEAPPAPLGDFWSVLCPQVLDDNKPVAERAQGFLQYALDKGRRSELFRDPPSEGVTIPKRCICAATGQCKYDADAEADSV